VTEIDRRSLIGVIAAAPLVLAVRPVEGKMMTNDTNIVELRQYTLRGGRRETLIALFERFFVEPQEAVGARSLGTSRDLDDPDRFVWLRGFRDMAQRAAALEEFYTGPVWRANREAANATMIDSDNVLLLRRRGAAGAPSIERPGLVTATIHSLGGTDSEAFARFFEAEMTPRLIADGAMPVVSLETETSANSFPRLPVREGDRVFVWFARWRGPADLEAFDRRWAGRGGWRDGASADLLPALMRKPERLRLVPTGLPSRI
jgi:hypothetical protein